MSFKVRKMAPAVLTKIHYNVDLTEDDVLQVRIGMRMLASCCDASFAIVVAVYLLL